MARVTGDEVKAIIPNVEASKDLTPHIETASLIITEELSSAGLSDARLTKIELWLAAHFAIVDIERGGLRRTTAGEGTEVYAVKIGQNLSLTRYGQMVLMLDPSDILRGLGSLKGRAQFTVV